MALWDEHLPQAEICLNNLLTYSPNPSMSAYAGLHGGALDFLRHPIAPAGTRVWSSATKATRIFDTLAWFPRGITIPGPSPRDTLHAAIILLHSALTEFTQLLSNLRVAAQPGASTVTSIINDLAGILGIPSPPSLGPLVLSTAPQPVPHTTPIVPPAPPLVHQDSCAEQRVITATGPPTCTDRRMTSPFTDSLLPQSDTHQSHIRPDHSTLPNTCITSIPTTQPTVPLPPQTITHLPRLAATSTLNLDDHGQLLRHSTAKTGINALRWQRA